MKKIRPQRHIPSDKDGARVHAIVENRPLRSIVGTDDIDAASARRELRLAFFEESTHAFGKLRAVDQLTLA